VEQFDEQQATDAAWTFLRSNSTASIAFGEIHQDVSYVIAPDGRLIIPTMVAMLQPCDTVMFVPEYSNDCMEMHITLLQFTEQGDGGALSDRWQVYHGEPPDVQWAVVSIDAARFHDMFIDGEGLCRKNPFAEVEDAICKELNANQDAVRALCQSKTNVEVTNPFVVGVDPLGVDIRAPFGIVRVPATKSFGTSDDVLQLFNV
jgi:hypothetical protein